MKDFFAHIELIWQKGSWLLWLCLIAVLPITSFPFFAKVLHTSAVAPASGMFLILLAVFWLPIFILKDGRFPFQVKSALLFFFISLLSIAAAFFRYIPDFKNHSLVNPAVEGIATLGLGALFYLTTSALPNTSSRVKSTLAVLNWSGLVMLAWSLIQIVVSLVNNDFTDGMRAIQHIFSTTVLFDRRATGFASEPSWLAHQINLVYLAYWISATLTKYSAHQFRIWKFSLENLLLAGGVVVLFVTFSRGGLAAFMLVIAFLFLLLNIRFVKWVQNKWKKRNKFYVSAVVVLLMVLLYAAIAFIGLFALSKLDPRMEKVFQVTNMADNPILKYAEDLQFGERVVYWQTGWNIFNDHPLFGVGVGYSGFYFPEYLPDYAWKLTEVKDLLYRSNGLLNIKSIWSRILAETGIIGFACFVTFLSVTGLTAKKMRTSPSILKRTLGWMGLISLVAFMIEGFSVDSFALPYYWFTFGLVGASWRWMPDALEKEKNG